MLYLSYELGVVEVVYLLTGCPRLSRRSLLLVVEFFGNATCSVGIRRQFDVGWHST